MTAYAWLATRPLRHLPKRAAHGEHAVGAAGAGDAVLLTNAAARAHV